MYCKNCGNPMLPEHKACLRCGYAKGNGAAFCHSCGARLQPGAAVCLKCGVAVQDAKKDGKSRICAGLLALFLGTFGVHNFYLGYIGKGVAQLLLSLVGSAFTCGMSVIAVEIWAIVEGIMIFAGKISTDASGVPFQD